MLENTNPLLMTFSDLKAYLTQWLSWQTFTLSAPLQHGIRLLRCLRPLSCALAFSRPCRVKQCQSSSVPKSKMRAACSCLLYAGRPLEQLPRTYQPGGLPSFPFGRGVSAISPLGTYDASNTGSSRQHGSQG